MNDFEKRLHDALQGATSDYRPSDPVAAKQRFMTRFRRRRFAIYTGSVALAGAAAAAAFFLVPAQIGDRQGSLPVAAPLPQELGSTDVGGAPEGIAFGSEVVWVASSETGVVSRIGPLSNQVGRTYDVGGAPEDVAVGLGAAWVSDPSAGTVTKIEFNSSDPTPLEVGSPGSAIDVAPGAGAVWVVVENEGLFEIDPASNLVTPVETSIEGLTDVAAGQGNVIVAGERELWRIDPATGQQTRIDVLDPSSDRDLQLSAGAIWVADGDAGEVARYDLTTGRHSDPVFVGGDFTAIASGEDAIWIVSGNENEEGNLTRIDPGTGQIVGEPVAIGGRPVDVTTGAGSVWVVSVDSGSVIRIDPNTLPN